MFWHILYYRPRGIPGNYKVAIAVSLHGGDGMNIERFGSSEKVEHFMTVPHNDIPPELTPYRYTHVAALSRFVPGHTFRITITDPEIAYPQRNSYGATREEIFGGAELGSIAPLYNLYLVDLDLLARNSQQWNTLFTGYSATEWQVIGLIKQALNLP